MRAVQDEEHTTMMTILKIIAWRDEFFADQASTFMFSKAAESSTPAPLHFVLQPRKQRLTDLNMPI